MKKYLLLFAMLIGLMQVNAQTWNKVTSADDLALDGEYIVVAETKNMAMVATGTSYMGNVAVTINNNQISTLPTTIGIVSFEGTDLKSCKIKISSLDGTSVNYYKTTAAKKMSLVTSAADATAANVSISGGNVVIDFGNTYGKLFYNASSPRFVNYTSSQTAIQLYKKAADDNREKVELAWNPAEITIELGDNFTSPVLSVSNEDARASVVYESETPELATVSADGVITLVEGATGEAKVTASIPNDNDMFYAEPATISIQVKRPLGDVIEDELTHTLFGVASTGSATYKNYSYTSTVTGIVYNANLCGGTDINYLQMRTSNSQSGIIVSANENGYKLVSVVIDWNSKSSDRKIDVYGSESAYTGSDASALFGSNQGTLLGSVGVGTTTLDISGDWSFIGIRSNNGALFINKITLIWEKPKTVNYTATVTLDVVSAEANNLTASVAVAGEQGTVDASEFDLYLGETLLGSADTKFEYLPYAPEQLKVRKGNTEIETTVEGVLDLTTVPEIAKVNYYKENDVLQADYHFAAPAGTAHLWYVEIQNGEEWTRLHRWIDGNAAHLIDNVGITDGETHIIDESVNFTVRFSIPFEVRNEWSTPARVNGDNTIQYVAAASKQYNAEEVGKEYEPVGELGTSGVADVVVDSEAAVEFYTLQGVKVEGELTPGLYIRRQGDKAAKVLVK